MKKLVVLSLLLSLAGFTASAQESTNVIPVCSPKWFQGTMGSCIGLNSMITEDIDHDGKTEIVCGAGTGYSAGLFWYVMRYDTTLHDYRQTWMSTPVDYFSGGDIFTCIRAFDVNNDQIFEIFVGHQNGLVKIYRGNDLSEIRSFSSGGTEVNDILFADADNDGQKEIVLCDDQQTYLFNTSNYTVKNTLPYGSDRFAAGNVDADQDIELVYSNGTILDVNGMTPVVEWNIYTPPLEYALVALTDTDSDGMEEVIIAQPWAMIEIFDADTRLLKGTIDTDIDIDALIVADVNGDTRKEILYGDGQWGSVFCYNALSLEQVWSIPNPQHGVTQVAVADADNDNQLEVLWGSGCSSSGKNFLYIHNISNQAFESRSKDISGPFYDVETGDVDGDGLDEIVTVSYESAQGNDSGILSVFDGTTGNLDWQCDGYFFPGTWRGIHALELADVTGDATKEIIVGTDRYYDGVVYIVSGITHQVISSEIYGFEGMNEILGLDVADTDGDGTPELAMADDRGVFVVDPVSLVIEWSVPYVSGFETTSVKIGNIDNDPNPEIIVCKGIISVFDGITHEMWFTDEQNFTNMDLYDYDNDGIREIIASTNNGKVLMIDRQTNLTTLLLQIGTSSIDGVRVVDPDGTGPPEFVLTIDGKIVFSNAGGDIVSTLSFGTGTGSFDGLKVSDLNNDGVFEIFAGASHQVVEVSSECSQCLGFKVLSEGTHASCFPGTDGTATGTPIAGTAPYSYQWSNGSTLQAITGLAPGQYILQVADSKGCPAQDTVIVAQSVILASVSGTDAGCTGVSDGTARVEIETGTPPYQFTWNNGSTLQAINGLAPGIYNCTVRDSLNCMATREYTITEPPPIILTTSFIPDNPATTEPDGQATVIATGGVPPYYYEWNDPYHQTNATASNLSKGHYTVQVIDASLCAQFAEVDLYGLSAEESNLRPINLKVYPNPASEVLNVSFGFSHPVSGTVELVNITGNTLISRKFSDSATGSYIFDLNGLPSSIYLVVLHSGEGTMTKRVIVDK